MTDISSAALYTLRSRCEQKRKNRHRLYHVDILFTAGKRKKKAEKFLCWDRKTRAVVMCLVKLAALVPTGYVPPSTPQCRPPEDPLRYPSLEQPRSLLNPIHPTFLTYILPFFFSFSSAQLLQPQQSRRHSLYYCIAIQCASQLHNNIF